MFTVNVSDRVKKFPPQSFLVTEDPSLANRRWYKEFIDRYAAMNGHPAFNPRTMEARKYYDRFWAEIVRGAPATAAPAAPAAPAQQPVAAPQQAPQASAAPVAVQTASGAGRVFTVNRKGTDYTFTSMLSDDEARFIVRLITDKKDHEFGQDLMKNWPNISAKQLAWVHKLAYDELRRRNDPRVSQTPTPPPPPPVYEPGAIKSRYKPQRRSKAYWPKGSEPNYEPQPQASVATMPQTKTEFPSDGDVVEASDLKLNGWPSSIEYNGMTYKAYHTEKDGEGEVLSVWYSSDDIFFLRVLND